MHLFFRAGLLAMASSIALSFNAIAVDAPQNSKVDNAKLLAEAISLLDGYRGNGAELIGAKQRLDAILRKDAKSASAYRELARYYIMGGHISREDFQGGSLEAADAVLKKAITINPKYAEAYVLQGHLYRLMERPVDAKAALTKAGMLGTDDPWLQNNWADLLIDEGNLTSAMERYTKVVDSKTENKKAMGAALAGLSEYYRKSGDLAKAGEMYRKMIDYEPGNAWNYGNYAWLLLCKQNDYEAAIIQARLALTHMNYGAGRQTLAAALFRKWAAPLKKGEKSEAAAARKEAESYSSMLPGQVLRNLCGESEATMTVEFAERAEKIRSGSDRQ